MTQLDVVPAQGYAGDITPEQTWELLTTDPSVVLVDVRTRAEWEHVGVPDVASVGKRTVFTQWVLNNGTPNPGFLADLKAGLAEAGVGEDATFVFLCRSGQRSIAAARVATAAGLGPSYNVLQGFEGAPGISGARDVEGWKVAGLPWRTTFAGGEPAGDAR
ncbi:Rhodanese domain protein [Xylanimonas cellulosilytica DSM 15894]|uniref:Rhodanese domain protein n=1 Tax=Xylanimonas cellulosilytica (strain DSM 15894 / JCM 12276 / CECT 5975 / KCTC 9989 / LMG 20990 / NBRC 107835 / XIL07) TaxID=446471 RepID=D1BZZ2_XYLCX|nr:rhodanese-like domain-containing protein [Xylanimonas cellulosilytica]ACZ32120.1 Rhodanese domain protein [Xylanimonas cellulosilytica DSM 15894]